MAIAVPRRTTVETTIRHRGSDFAGREGPIARAAIALGVFVVAAVIYAYGIGTQALGPSEAYSALAASQPTVAKVVGSALRYDPGKPLFYHLLLHWFCTGFGPNEGSLRAMSLIFGLASAALVFAYGTELFGFEIGVAAAALWGFSPMAILFARWARMYSIFVAFGVGHLAAMEHARRKPALTSYALAGALGGAMLYTHLGGVLIIGAECLVAARDLHHAERHQSWIPLAMACAMFAPFLPVAVAQTHSLFFGHWLDWIGVAHEGIGTRLAAAVAGGMTALWMVFGARGSQRIESLRRTLIYVAAPPAALIAASIVIRPIFSVRYVAPSVALAMIMVAYGLDLLAARTRNLAVVGLSAFLLILTPLTYRAEAQPWREIASQVAAAGEPSQPVFFESGFFSDAKLISDAESDGFPEGFFRAPFDYYFDGKNPRAVIPGSDPVRSRELIATQVRKTGGAWLISGKSPEGARAEIPFGPLYLVDKETVDSRVVFIHVRLIP